MQNTQKDQNSQANNQVEEVKRISSHSNLKKISHLIKRSPKKPVTKISIIKVFKKNRAQLSYIDIKRIIFLKTTRKTKAKY